MSMHLPPLHPISDSVYYTSGEVVVDPSAGIAPGVMLQADPDSRIEIGAGVCIGMGSILHAHEGTLRLETGVTLGTGVLIIGQGTVGPKACIGSSSTLIDTSIEAHRVIPPGSLIGDQSRVEPQTEPEPMPESELNRPEPTDPVETVEHHTAPPPAAVKSTRIPGQDHLSRLLLKIYPHRQSSNGTRSDPDDD